MSDWKQRAVKRRDERHTKAPDIRPPGGSKKNTKRWCRGVVGREHQPKCTNGAFAGWKVLACEVCGRHLDYYIPWPGMRERPTPPAWVTQS